MINSIFDYNNKYKYVFDNPRFPACQIHVVCVAWHDWVELNKNNYKFHDIAIYRLINGWSVFEVYMTQFSVKIPFHSCIICLVCKLKWFTCDPAKLWQSAIITEFGGLFRSFKLIFTKSGVDEKLCNLCCDLRIYLSFVKPVFILS